MPDVAGLGVIEAVEGGDGAEEVGVVDEVHGVGELESGAFGVSEMDEEGDLAEGGALHEAAEVVGGFGCDDMGVVGAAWLDEGGGDGFLSGIGVVWIEGGAGESGGGEVWFDFVAAECLGGRKRQARWWAPAAAIMAKASRDGMGYQCMMSEPRRDA